MFVQSFKNYFFFNIDSFEQKDATTIIDINYEKFL